MLGQIKIDVDPGVFSELTTGAGPYMGAAAFMALIQLLVIKQVSDKRWRTALLVASVFFQMLALGFGLFRGV